MSRRTFLVEELPMPVRHFSYEEAEALQVDAFRAMETCEKRFIPSSMKKEFALVLQLSKLGLEKMRADRLSGTADESTTIEKRLRNLEAAVFGGRLASSQDRRMKLFHPDGQLELEVPLQAADSPSAEATKDEINRLREQLKLLEGFDINCIGGTISISGQVHSPCGHCAEAQHRALYRVVSLLKGNIEATRGEISLERAESTSTDVDVSHLEAELDALKNFLKVILGEWPDADNL